jgi:hypothetical protein
MTAGEPFPLAGPAGALEAVLDRPAGPPRSRAVVSHPHPLYGGTMDNAVVVLATRALVAAGAETLRFNFRGVGRSAGVHDRGRGERDDLAAAADAVASREPRLPLLLAGYSFGAAMTLEHLASRGAGHGVAGVLLIAPPFTHYDGAAWRFGTLPLAVIYGERDSLTPPEALRENAARWSAAAWCEALPGAAHDLGSLAAPRALEAALARAVAALACGS